MRDTTSNKYSDTYEIAREPRSMAAHNQISWLKVKECINSHTPNHATYEELNNAVKGHLHHGKTAGNEHLFIIHCIKNGWLKVL